MNENKQIAEMLQACPYNDGEYCNRCEYHGEYCDGKCEVGETIENLIKKEPATVKEIFDEIHEALTVESYKAFHHEYDRIKEVKRQGARAAINNIISIIAEIEKKHLVSLVNFRRLGICPVCSPCSIGQTVYSALVFDEEKDGSPPFVEEWVVKKITFDGIKWYASGDYDEQIEVGGQWCKLTREEAEKTLKELTEREGTDNGTNDK